MKEKITEEELDNILREYRNSGLPCGISVEGIRKTIYCGKFVMNNSLYSNKYRKHKTYLGCGIQLLEMIDKYKKEEIL